MNLDKCRSKLQWSSHISMRIGTSDMTLKNDKECIQLAEKFFCRMRLRSGKLELISTRNEGFFDAGDMTDHSSGK